MRAAKAVATTAGTTHAAHRLDKRLSHRAQVGYPCGDLDRAGEPHAGHQSGQSS